MGRRRERASEGWKGACSAASLTLVEERAEEKVGIESISINNRRRWLLRTVRTLRIDININFFRGLDLFRRCLVV